VPGYGQLLVSNGCLTTAGANFFCSGSINGGTFATDLGAADNTGVADASSYVNTAIAAQVASYLGSGQTIPLPGGQFYVPSLSNIYGVPFSGMGRLLKPINQTAQNSSGSLNIAATQAQQNSYAYAVPRLIFGQEYASRWFGLVATYQAAPSATPIKVLGSGDSTMAGNNTNVGCDVVAGCDPASLFSQAAVNHGIQGVGTSNGGHSGKDTADWLNLYLAPDQATNPDVYVIRWGINDAFFGITPAQTIANIRTGLSCIRQGCTIGSGNVIGKTIDQETIVLETPSSTNDNPNGRSALFYEQLRNGFAQAARDYQAVFIDNYGSYPDNDFAVQGSMMDAPYTYPITSWSITSNVVTFQSVNSLVAGNTVTISGLASGAFMNAQTLTVIGTGLSGTQFEANFTHANASATEAGLASMPGTTPIHIHPGGAKAPLYNKLLEQALLDPLDVISSTQLANVSGQTLIPAVALLAPSYPYEYSIFRTDGTWPFNGMVITEHQVDGIWSQRNVPFSGTAAGAYAMRMGTASAWGAWTYFQSNGLNMNPLPASYSSGVYAGLVGNIPDILLSDQANATNAKLANIYEDTSGNIHFQFCNDANTSCTDFLTANRSGASPVSVAFGVGTGTAYPVLTATLTTTAASSDVVSLPGMASTGHCSFGAANASAATNYATTYISSVATPNQITVAHATISGMIYYLLCAAF
jgi:hypothetical protein